MRFVEPGGGGGILYCILFFFGGDYVKKDSKVMNTKLGMKVNGFNLENIVTFFFFLMKLVNTLNIIMYLSVADLSQSGSRAWLIPALL